MHVARLRTCAPALFVCSFSKVFFFVFFLILEEMLCPLTYNPHPSSTKKQKKTERPGCPYES